MKERLYLETSVISYYTARPSRDVVTLAQQEITWEWWEKSLHRFEVFISEAVVDEIRRGDQEAAAKRFDLVKDFPQLAINEDVESLAAIYVDKLQIPPKAEADAIHIALACRYGVDYLMTWNCSHIANGIIIKQLQKINTDHDIKTPIICTPGELLEIDYGE